MCAQHDQCRCARSQLSLFNLLKLVYREDICWKVKIFFQNFFFVEKCKILVSTENIFFSLSAFLAVGRPSCRMATQCATTTAAIWTP